MRIHKWPSGPKVRVMNARAVIRRQVARVLLFDEQDRLLLFHVVTPPTRPASLVVPARRRDGPR